MRHLYICFFLFPFLGFSSGDILFIKLEYIGNIDKPIPEVVFFVDSGNFDKTKFIDGFKVSGSEFQSLEYLINSDHTLFSKMKNRYYMITIYNGTSKEYFFIKNKQSVANAFKKLAAKLKLSNQEAQIESEFTYVLSRI
jgi:hypothetical protein